VAPLTPQEKQWLSAISFAEGTYRKGLGPQYNIMFGGGTFSDLSRHPDTVVKKPGIASAAAGAYQFMPGTWSAVSKKLGLKGFGPAEQNQAALELIRQRGVDPRKDPITPETISKLAPEWAGLPTLQGKSYYANQSVKRFADIQNFLKTTGGAIPSGSSVQNPASPAAARVSLPRFDFKDAVKKLLLRSSLENVGAPVAVGGQALAIQQQANALREEGKDDEAEILESQMTASLAADAQTPAADPTSLVRNILEIRKQAADYDAQVSQIEKSVNDVAINQTAQEVGTNLRTAARPAQGFARTASGGIAYPNAVVTSAVDASGEPGLDFALAGGRGAAFALPFKAQVLKVVKEPNAGNRGPGGRGYGNYVELRGVSPEGKQFDALVAHFDAVNPNLKPGMVLNPGAIIGKQGETGRATGPHISLDFFDPGKTTASRDILRIRDIVASRIAKGLPPFG
jgi:muramidase (phage lysozyme)